jgi:hypothetical protein
MHGGFYWERPMPYWLTIVDTCAKVVIAIMSPILGYFAYKIAKRQADTARDKLKLDLYDRRYAVYLSLNEWINDLQQRVVPDEEYTAHIRKMEQAQFLFGEDVNDWLRDLRGKARVMNRARRESREISAEGQDGPRRGELSAATAKYHELTLSFDGDLDLSGSVFAPYLDFSKNL